MAFRQLLRLLIASAGVASLEFAPVPPPNLQAMAQQPTDTPVQPKPTLKPQERPADVPYVPTPQSVVDEMLKIANVGQDDVVYDLGSGDGRIVITAARTYGARGVGIDINPSLVQAATENAREAGVSNLVEFRQQDLFKTDLSQATVVTLYLLPQINLQLRPKLLQELKPGTRIVSHAFSMGDWHPEKVVKVNGRTIYYWTVPKQVPQNLLRPGPNELLDGY
ncbi:methyltransferase domain-containing protein [Leptothermofonsia sichuanensis E412]|uniref:methyltransferase domain-containing protein n=1 Tax=Leptothermofonsia sichuanensis TaxID=2917832 RepID=UPI001CA699EE|nr:methyltransferase domain-containing protein [Leptothermofonsia sichuanensis]QZZ18677.1 methyltransferase domain-containing protein [Leptothermofonsia sichuanensis E412]